MAEELFFEFPTEEGNGDEYEEEGYDELVSETEIDTEDEIDTYFNSDNDVLKSGENIRKELHLICPVSMFCSLKMIVFTLEKVIKT